MSVNLKPPVSLLPISGIRLAAVSANIYEKERNDLALFELSPCCSVSAVFTKNNFCAAPVKLAKLHINKNNPRYLLVNAGNANAGTGEQGLLNSVDTCINLAKIVECDESEVLPFSTGVIGEDLPVSKINKALPELVNKLSIENWQDVAAAIMTTDTIPKAVSKNIRLNSKEISITGLAKGAGMIRPDMATMLAYIATDACVEKSILDNILLKAVNKSFNRITIDGDTSTNDSCVLIATGKQHVEALSDIDSDEYRKLEDAIVYVCTELAQMVVRDGEGATKFITIDVNGGSTSKECLAVAYKIAESPLVKTAMTASDPNWGRILAAVGNADIEDLKIDNVNVYLDDVCIVANGQRAANYVEVNGKNVMIQDEIRLLVELGRGECRETVWTTDLSYEYIKINAEYRT